MNTQRNIDLNPPVEITDPEWDRLVPDPSALREAREGRGLSREAMARLIGCTAGSCANWESGTVPTKSLRDRVLRAYGVTAGEAGR